MATTGPYHFDLFAVSNHMGNLSNGHCEFSSSRAASEPSTRCTGLIYDPALNLNSDTAFVNSSKGWQYCDDSKITPAAERDVIVGASVRKVRVQSWANRSHLLFSDKASIYIVL